MYKLYTRPGSGGFVVEAALALANAPFEQIDVPKTDRPDPAFLGISPLNQVPVLTLPDGRSITESAAICVLLAERHPDARLAPAIDAPARAARPRDSAIWRMFTDSATMSRPPSAAPAPATATLNSDHSRKTPSMRTA